MLEANFANQPFYSNLNHEIDPRRVERRQDLIARGCTSWLTGRYFILFQLPSAVRQGKFCTVIIREEGFLASGTCFVANVNEKLLKALKKYQFGIPDEISSQYPVLSDILRPGSDKIFEDNKVVFTIPQGISIRQNTVLSDTLRNNATLFVRLIEQAYREAEAILQTDVEAVTANLEKDVEFISDTDLKLPNKLTVNGITVRYCEQIKSKFWGTKRYPVQIFDGPNIYTIYIKHAELAQPKCCLVAYMRILDLSTIEKLTDVYTTDVPAEFRQRFPAISNFVTTGNLPNSITMMPHEVSLKTTVPFDLTFNRDLPDEVFTYVPAFVTLVLNIINELGQLRRTALYTQIRRASLKKGNAKGNALLIRLAMMGVGALIGASFDTPDCDLSTDIGDTPDLGTGSDVDVSTDTGDSGETTTTTPISFSGTGGMGPMPPSPSGMGYLVHNPFGDPAMMNDMIDFMHDNGKFDDASYNFIQNLNDMTERQHERTLQMQAELDADFEEALSGGRKNAVGPSPADWDRFDSYESTRENAVDAYKRALDSGNLDEASRQADIARDAQLKKEGIYSVQYTPMDLDKRAGLL